MMGSFTSVMGASAAAAKLLLGPSGFFIGGSSTSTTNFALLFSTETGTVLGSSPTSSGYAQTPISNRAVAGYTIGGSDNGYAVDKYSFPSRTKSTNPSFGIEINWGVGWDNGSTCGYVGGGYVYPSYSTTVYKYTYSTETRSTAGGSTPFGGSFTGMMSNYGVAGYQLGGLPNGTNPRVATVGKYNFSNESGSTITSLTIARDAVGGFANDGVAGYAAGGYYGDTYSTVDKYAFPSDSRSTLSTGLYENMRGVAGVAKAGTAGYVSGGAGAFGITDYIQKFSFPGDTRSIIAQRAPAATQFQTSFSSTA